MTALAERLDERAQQHRAAAAKLPVTSALPVAVPVALVVGAVVGLLLTWWLGVVVGLAAGAGAFALRFRTLSGGALAALLDVLGARPATDAEFPRYLNLVEGLCISTGIPEPALYVVDDPAANAAAIGAPGEGAIVVTTGLLDSIGRVELEGVLAECLHRLRVHEAELSGLAATIVGRPILRTPAAGTPPQAAVARSARIAALLGDQRHFLADLAACSITRFPPGLRDALVGIERQGTAVAGATWGTVHLWMCDPLPHAGGEGAAADPPALSDHPPIQHRIDLLAEL